MGRRERPMPRRLSGKLYLIRKELGLTQEQMAKKVKQPGIRIYQGHISEYERREREPPLAVLLQYARLAGISMELLVDDEQQLPERYWRHFDGVLAKYKMKDKPE